MEIQVDMNKQANKHRPSCRVQHNTKRMNKRIAHVQFGNHVVQIGTLGVHVLCTFNVLQTLNNAIAICFC